jgi:Na+-driven multidrug efflux pump
MNTPTFLFMLSGFSVLSGLVVEGIKKFVPKASEQSYNAIALIVALIVGGVGTLTYYQLNDIAFTLNNFIYAALMGLASGLTSMVGYDKVKEAVNQLVKKGE